MLWVLMLSVPFPYIATTAGWWTAELGRQPWVVHGLLRTVDAGSPQVSAGDVVFTTLGFAGLYLLLGILFVYQVIQEMVAGTRRRPIGDADGDGLVRRSCRRCWPSTWSSTASTSAPASCTAWSPGPTRSGGRCWRPSSRSGTATRSG